MGYNISLSLRHDCCRGFLVRSPDSVRRGLMLDIFKHCIYGSLQFFYFRELLVQSPEKVSEIFLSD